MNKHLTAIAFSLAATHAIAKPACYENPNTNAYTCYDSGNVSEADGIRYSKMFEGGPLGIKATGFAFAVNCSNGMVHLKDRQGVTFGGGHKSATPAIEAIATWICAEKIKKK